MNIKSSPRNGKFVNFQYKAYQKKHEALKDEEYGSNSEAQTSLQAVVTNPRDHHFVIQPIECRLVEKMLSFDYLRRPSCKDIVDTVNTVALQKSLESAQNMEVPNIPLLHQPGE